ncbi:MAG TPA: hypothetical protein VGX94_08290, partial [Terriglobia bacterium]|nr:hypothetical protein [Terriglobia bacterium]
MPENENHRSDTGTLDRHSEISAHAGANAEAQTNIPARAVSEKRRAANQASALKSTGPQTPEGKRRAAFNSFQHGAFASEDHILHEALDRAGYDAQAFDARRQELLDDWQPGGAQQRQVIGDLAWLYWLRDRDRVALLEMQARSAPRLELERDWRRFNTRHRPVSFDHSDYYPDGGATADASPDKFKVMGEFLDDLESMITRRKWSDEAMGRCEYNAHSLAKFVWGQTPNTARGREFLRLYDQCAEKRAKADDPRVAQLLAWIAEERAALAEEEGLEARERAIDVEQPEEMSWPELRPLGEAWQEAERRLQQMERQIDAKIRLLLRLEKRAQNESSKPGVPSEYNELSKLGEHTTPYKPDEIIARTSEAEVRGLSSGTW